MLTAAAQADDSPPRTYRSAAPPRHGDAAASETTATAAPARRHSLIPSLFTHPLGFAGRSSVLPREDQETPDFVPMEDRWRIGFLPWDRYGKGHPTADDYPYQEGNMWDPYNQNILKGDYPILGSEHLFEPDGGKPYVAERPRGADADDAVREHGPAAPVRVLRPARPVLLQPEFQLLRGPVPRRRRVQAGGLAHP